MCRQSPLFTHDFLLGMQTQLPLYTLSGFSLGVQAISTLYSQDFLSSAAADHQLPFVQCQNSLVFQACGVAFNDIAEAPNSLLFQAHGFKVFNHILPKLPPSCIAKEFQSFTISPCAHM
jgi:hypothetical protein